jgi:hypothetical protein
VQIKPLFIDIKPRFQIAGKSYILLKIQLLAVLTQSVTLLSY